MSRITRSQPSMLEGPIWKGLISFAIPILLGNLFQQLYNTADTIIVGNFIGKEALAAVSSSGNLIHMLIGLLQGDLPGCRNSDCQKLWCKGPGESPAGDP